MIPSLQWNCHTCRSSSTMKKPIMLQGKSTLQAVFDTALSSNRGLDWFGTIADLKWMAIEIAMQYQSSQIH